MWLGVPVAWFALRSAWPLGTPPRYASARTPRTSCASAWRRFVVGPAPGTRRPTAPCRANWRSCQPAMWSRITTRNGGEPGTVFAAAGAAVTSAASAGRRKTSKQSRRSIVRPDSLSCAAAVVEVPPPLLDPARPPDHRRHPPREDEHGDDDVAQAVHVQPSCLHHELQQLDASDAQRDGDRERSDGDVVVDLAHRVREGPAVRVAHEGAVRRVEQGHAGGEEQREREDGCERHVAPRRTRREREQADLGGGVVAETEEDAEREHLPARVDAVAEALEHAAAHQPTIEEPRLEPVLVETAPPHVAEDPDDVHEHEQVEDADREQKRARHTGADRPAPVLERRDPLPNARRRESEPGREGEHDARVAEREEEADAVRASPVLQELPRRVVDRRDVVGVERVPQPERVRERPEPDQRGVRARVIDEQAPPGGVEGADRAAEQGQPTPVHAVTFGSARTVMATPAARMTSAETAGRARTRSPSMLRLENARLARTAASPSPVIDSASPSENATMRTSPNARRCREIAASRTTSADGQGRRPPETPTASRLRRDDSCSWWWWWWW